MIGRLSAKLLLNGIGLTATAVGLANTLLAWKLFGIGREADMWITAVLIAQSFALLSQLGVEQVALFQSEANARGSADGHQFKSSSLLWSLVFGCAFSGLLLLLLRQVAQLFGGGFTEVEQRRLVVIVAPLLLWVAVAPSQFWLRQQLYLAGRNIVGTALGIGLPLIQLLALANQARGAFPSAQSTALHVGLASLAFGVSAPLLVMRVCPSFDPQGLRGLGAFVRSSFEIRAAHSLHNFISVVLTNSALSFGTAGAVALFQYGRKIAEGLAAVAIGPHAAIYHARQALAWSSRNRAAFVQNVTGYLTVILPLLALSMALFLLFGGPLLARTKTASPAYFDVLLPVVGILFLWQAVIAVETVLVGMVVLAKRAKVLIAVNATFIALYALALQAVPTDAALSHRVAATAIGCQLVSTALLCFFGLGSARRAFK